MATAKHVAEQLAIERGLNIRNPASSVFCINSRDRYNSNLTNSTISTSPYNCTLRSDQNFMTGYFERIALTEIVFPWSLYTFNAFNNVMYIRVGAGAGTYYQIVIPPGWYVPTCPPGSTVSAVTGEITTGGFATGQYALDVVFQITVRALAGNPLPAFTCVARKVDGYFVAASNSVEVFVFATWTTNPAGFAPAPISANATTVFEMMNWHNNGTAAAIKNSGQPTMLWTKYVDIVCSQITQNQDVRDGTTQKVGNRDILARVYLQDDATTTDINLGGSPFVIYRQYTYPKQIKFDPIMPIQGFLSFQLFNDAGDLLQTDSAIATGDSPDWQITLLVSET